VGSQYIHDFQQSMKTPTQQEEMRRAVELELHAKFRPEFLNRVDDVIIFHALGMEHIKRIVDIQLRRLAKTASDRKLVIEMSDPAREVLAREGYDPAFGARPLKRALQRMVIDPLAMRILEGSFKPGDTVFVNASDDGTGLVLSSEPESVHVN